MTSTDKGEINAWTELQGVLNEFQKWVVSSIQEDTVSVSLEGRELMIQGFCDLIDEFAINCLRSYIFQQDFQIFWKALNDQGIHTLSDFLKKNPGTDPFAMTA